MDNESTLNMYCFFCKSTNSFVLPNEYYIPQSGDQILCANCGKTNDYDSLVRVLDENVEKLMEKKFNCEIDKFTKGWDKLFK